MRLLALVALGVTALAASLTGCAGDRDALTIYSGRTENLVGPLLERFAEETGIAVDVRYGDSADLALLLGEEGDRTPADVFFSQSPGAVGYLAERRLLAPLGDAVVADVDPRFRSETGLWLGVTGRQRVLVYNEDTVSEDGLPASVYDLAGEEYAGRVGLAPSNASFQDFVSVMRQIDGDERTRDWLEAMAAGDPPVYANNNAIVEAVGRGEVEMGLVNHYYNFRFLDEDPGLPSRNYVFPDGDLGSILLVASVSVLEGSDRAEEAERFVEFLLSREAQEYFRDQTFEYPLAAGAEPPEGLAPLDTIQLPEYSIEELGEELEGTVDMIAASGLEG